MYCPRCGQQQISGNLKFCSRCGLPMSLVSEVVSNDGSIPRLEELDNRKGTMLNRRNGIIFSLLWFLFFILIVTPFWAILEVDEMAALSGVTGVFGSLIIFLMSIFFLPKRRKIRGDGDQASYGTPSLHIEGAGARTGLPPHQGQTAQEYVSPQPESWRAPDTDDLARPGSVTEGTTRLLEKEESPE